MTITTKTKKVGLLGWPLGHSLSPAMHNVAIAANKLDYVYLPLPTPPELLPQAVNGLRALGFSGVNVTIPHKIAIIDCLDELDASAALVGAVNTVVFRDGRLIGYNTDAGGYIRSLTTAGVSVNGKHAVILGAGGAARAVVAGFIGNGINTVTIGARDATKANTTAAAFSAAGRQVTGVTLDSQDFIAALANADIIVNTTSLGMYPNVTGQPQIPWERLKPSAVISDVVYNPLITQFLAEAARRGHKTVTGEGMLAEQGALAFSLWTGCAEPSEIMRQTLLQELNGKN